MSLDALNKEIGCYDKHTFQDDAERRQALASARALCRRLETPMDTVLRSCWIEPATITAAHVCKEADVFSKLAADDGKPKSTQHLAAATGLNEALASRLLRHLSTVDFLVETGSEEWAPNDLTRALTEPRVNGGFNMVFDFFLRGASHLSDYFKKTGYQNPAGCPGPIQYALGTEDPLFVWLGKNPEKLQGFQNHMAGYTSDRPGWLEVMDTSGIVDKFDKTKGDALLVDVGGGYGQDVRRFSAKYPNAPGRLVLQDQPAVIAKSAEIEGVEKIPHDFFTSQPIKGARTYFMHSILHDYNDQQCKEILENLKPALVKGYSTLLINEMVIAETNAHVLATSMDILLMVCMGAGERKAQQWHALLDSVGYKIVKIHTNLAVPESVIEAELA